MPNTEYTAERARKAREEAEKRAQETKAARWRAITEKHRQNKEVRRKTMEGK